MSAKNTKTITWDPDYRAYREVSVKKSPWADIEQFAQDACMYAAGFSAVLFVANVFAFFGG